MVEQKHPADIFAEALDYLWNGLNLSEKGWKRLKKGDFKKKMLLHSRFRLCKSIIRCDIRQWAV